MKISTKLKNIISHYETTFFQIAIEDWNYKPSETRWSKKEILGHLIDSARINYQRFEKRKKTNNLIFQTYNQDQFVRQKQYQDADIKKLISEWKNINFNLAEFLDSMPIDQINKEHRIHNFDQICMSKVAVDSPQSLSFLAWDYLFHLNHHCIQIAPNNKFKLKAFKSFQE